MMRMSRAAALGLVGAEGAGGAGLAREILYAPALWAGEEVVDGPIDDGRHMDVTSGKGVTWTGGCQASASGTRVRTTPLPLYQKAVLPSLVGRSSIIIVYHSHAIISHVEGMCVWGRGGDSLVEALGACR